MKPRSKTEILSQTIWNNKYITIDKKMVYLSLWHRAGIKQISDLFDENENCFLPFLSLRNKYTLTCNFLQYHDLISAIPKSWKKLLYTNSGDPITPPAANLYYNVQDVIWQTVNPWKSSSSHLRKKIFFPTVSQKRIWIKFIFYRSKPQKKLN